MARIHLVGILPFFGIVLGQFEPNWGSLSTRKTPAWFDEAKIGISVMWGLFSIPAFGGNDFERLFKENDPAYVAYMEEFFPTLSYNDFPQLYTARYYKPEEWAQLFKYAGAKYVVFNAKYADGFCHWKSPYSHNWNSVFDSPKMDLVGTLKAAINKVAPDMRFGLHYSLTEWYHPSFLQDKGTKFKDTRFPTIKVRPEMKQMVNLYKPEIMWINCNSGLYDKYWNSTSFLAWLFNESPVKDSVVVNDRWSVGSLCVHGSFRTCGDRYIPDKVTTEYKWENIMSLNKNAWSYIAAAKLQDYLTIEELLAIMAETMSKGGNLLVNVGPTAEGSISVIEEERLRQMGDWLAINGEAVYNTKPWSTPNDQLSTSVWFTAKDDIVYAWILDWPENGLLKLNSVLSSNGTEVKVIGYSRQLQVCLRNEDAGITVKLPPYNAVQSPWVRVLQMKGVIFSSQQKGMKKI